jgi:hypothetical protein
MLPSTSQTSSERLDDLPLILQRIEQMLVAHRVS